MQHTIVNIELQSVILFITESETHSKDYWLLGELRYQFTGTIHEKKPNQHKFLGWARSIKYQPLNLHLAMLEYQGWYWPVITNLYFKDSSMFFWCVFFWNQTICGFWTGGCLMQHNIIAERFYRSFLQYYCAAFSSPSSLYLYYLSICVQFSEVLLKMH